MLKSFQSSGTHEILVLKCENAAERVEADISIQHLLSIFSLFKTYLYLKCVLCNCFLCFYFTFRNDEVHQAYSFFFPI